MIKVTTTQYKLDFPEMKETVINGKKRYWIQTTLKTQVYFPSM